MSDHPIAGDNNKNQTIHDSRNQEMRRDNKKEFDQINDKAADENAIRQNSDSEASESGSHRTARASYISWGLYIKDLRESHLYTQSYVADHIGMSSSAYGYHERGERTPTPAMVIALSVLYNINVLELLAVAVEDENPSYSRLFVKEEPNYAGPKIPVSPDGRTHEWITERERYLLEHYRSQPQAVKNYIDKMIGTFNRKR